MATRSRSASRYRHTPISLDLEKGGIQLSERQKQLLENRKQMKKLADFQDKPQVPDTTAPVDKAKKDVYNEKQLRLIKAATASATPQLNDDWADQVTTTAPSTSWGSSSAASTDSSFTNPAHSFYGQGLKGKAKKLYDDTGASYYESKSEASSAPPSAVSSAVLSTGTSKAPSTVSSVAPPKSVASSAAASSSSSSSRKKATTEETQNDDKSKQVSPEKRRRNDLPPTDKSTETSKKLKPEKASSKSGKEKSSRRLSKFGQGRSKASNVSTDDTQRAFLRKMMQSYTSKGKSKQNPEDSESEASSKGNSKPNRLSWSNRRANRKSNIFSSARSGSSSSSASQDKAIMKKVLERARKKKISSNPRKQNFVKQSSSRMKKLLSPRNKKPGSPEGPVSKHRGGSKHSFFGSRKLKSPKNQSIEPSASRWSNDSNKDSLADDEAEPRTRFLDPEPLASSFGSTAIETASESASNDSHGVMAGANSDSSNSKRDDDRSTEVKWQAIDMSGLTRKSSSEKEDDDTRQQKTVRAPRYTIQSHPDVVNDEEIEIKLSVSSLSQRFESSGTSPKGMEELKTSESKLSHTIGTVRTTDTTPLHANYVTGKPDLETASDATSYVVPDGYDEFMNAARKEFVSYEEKAQDANKEVLDYIYSEEPEGYSEFVQTLQSEVSGSHSKLWKSFRALFRGEKSADKLNLGCGGNRPFDDKTKGMVTNMSSYLKDNYDVESVSGDQVANDDAVKGSLLRKAKFGKHMLRPTGITPKYGMAQSSSFASMPKKSLTDGASVESASSQKYESASLPPESIDGINDDEDHRDFEVVQTHNKRKDIEGENPISTDVTSSNKEPAVKHFNSIGLDSGKRSVPTNVNNTTSKKRRFQPVEPASTEVSIPWSGIKLRSVLDGSRSESSSESIPASWTKVKLRHVESKGDKSKSSGSQSSASVGSSDSIHRILVRKPSAEKKRTPKAESNNVDVKSDTKPSSPKEQKDSPKSIEKREDTNQVAVVQDSSPDASSATGSMESTEGSVVVSLAPEKDIDNPSGLKVVVGKKGIMKIEVQSGETKARVIWRLDHEDLKSAMLDMSACKIKLLLEDNEQHKDLSFASSEQCMKFANVLHEMTNAMDDDSNETSNNSEESIYVEQLSEEEQRVLEEFRQKKRKSFDPENDPSPTFQQEPVQQMQPLQRPVHPLFQRSVQPLLTIDSGLKPPSVVNAPVNVPMTPMSEISGASTSLGDPDAKAAAPYLKMLKLQVPEEAVRHKMEKDQVDPRIMAIVLGEGEPKEAEPSSSNGLTVKELKIAARFEKMLKMMVPPEAVRHEMEKNGIEEKIIIAVLGQDKEEKKTTANTDKQLSEAEQKIAESYKKMLKMMVPKEAVEHKMRKDQVDPKIIMIVVGGNPEDFKPKSNTQQKEKKEGLTDEEESVASAYRTMLKLKIPKEAVRHKMKQEGISEKIIAAVLGEKPPKDSAPKKTPQRRGIKPGFHWSPLPSGKELQKSIWARKKPLIDDSSVHSEESIAIMKHVEQFQKKAEGSEAKTKKLKTNSESKEMAKLIDLNRANNVAISLNAYKDFSHEELSNIINFVDPFEKISGDRALTLRDLLPAAAESKVIKNYKGEEDRLIPAEKWFQKIVDIKRIDEKIHVIRTIETFKAEARGLEESFELLTNVCNQVMNSEKLPDVLEMVRQIGNRMNEGRGEEAAGFRLDFLPRLAQTKGSDKKTTAFDLVVMIFMQRNEREALTLTEDLGNCQEAGRIQITDLVSEVRRLGGAMRKCGSELLALRKDAGIPARPIAAGSDSKSESAVEKSAKRKNFRSNQTEVRTDVSSMHHELFAKRSQFIDSVLKGLQPKGEQPKPQEGDKSEVGDILKAVQNAKHPSDDNQISPRASLTASQSKKNLLESETSKEREYTFTASIERVEQFMTEAQKDVFPRLEAQRDRAVDACKELSDFFCESGGERAAPGLLSILAEFSNNLDRAVSKYDYQQKAELRKKKAAKRRSSLASKSSQPEIKESTSEETSGDDKTEEKKAKSLVLMVNEMLKVAGDKEKNDFANGVTYEDPANDKLKTIYQQEQARRQSQQLADSPRRCILHSIQKRKQTRPKDVDEGLSELAQAMARRVEFAAKEDEGVEQEEKHTARRVEFAAKEDEGVEQQDEKHTPEIAHSTSLTYSEDSSQVGSFDDTINSTDVDSLDKIDEGKEAAPSRSGRRKSSIAERWTRKVEDDDDSDTDLAEFEQITNRRRSSIAERWSSQKVEEEEPAKDARDDDDEGDDDLEKTDSEILSSDSHDSEDRKIAEKRRQQYVSRWKSHDSIVEAASKDLEEESDVGASFEFKNRTRQRYMNRWARKSDEHEEEESIPDALL